MAYGLLIRAKCSGKGILFTIIKQNKKGKYTDLFSPEYYAFMIHACNIIVILALLLNPVSGEAKMNALSNNSLREVKAGESETAVIEETSVQKTPTEGDGKQSSAQKTTRCTQTGASMNDKNRLVLFRQCPDYRNFLSFVQKLARISAEKRYPELIHSEQFLSLCSNFASASYRCEQKLLSLNLRPIDTSKKDILTIHQELFRQASLFHKLVYQHQKLKKPLPDLDQFLVQIKTGLNAIDAEYAEL
jgi:hypothetical protein